MKLEILRKDQGIVLGLVPVTLAGLFVTAYLQYLRGDQLNI